MKIGLYDSGLGGLSVLKKFLENFPGYEYLYFGDSQRAPYGEKSPGDLINYVYEIFDFMQEQNVELVVSACNTSSMFLDQMDLSKYSFKVISLFEVMKEFFALNNAHKQVALLATATNIESNRFKEWNANIYPLKCPKLVPLVEKGDLESAKKEFANYLNQLPQDVNDVVIGCTHYSFLSPPSSRFNFIDPAELVVNSKNLIELISKPNAQNLPPQIFVSGDLSIFKNISEQLISHKADFHHKPSAAFVNQ